MQGKKTGRCREAGLSEVIGFILIIGLIVVIASLYLTYGVPAQGRENEILHMNLVKDQFVTYKISLDSLFNNDKVGTAVSNSFTLGTSGGYTQGSFTFIPLMSPVNSGGIIAINERTEAPEMLLVQSDSLIINKTIFYRQDLPATLQYTPDHIYINISGIHFSDLNQNGNFGATVEAPAWRATVNLTPRVTSFVNYTSQQKTRDCPASPDGPVLDLGANCLIPHNNYRYSGSDLTISITKGNIDTMQNYPVYENIVEETIYTIDLMDDAYGLKPLTNPSDTVAITTGKILGSIAPSGNATYNFAGMNPYTASPIPLGAIEYRAQNNYWIPQTYYYQMGGVFLKQIDGNITYKLPPEITLSYDDNEDPEKKIVTVNINALAIDQDNSGAVGGNSPVQIKTTLKNITDFPYARGNANTKWIKIGVQTEDPQARAMWQNYFTYEALAKGIPNYEFGQDGTESYIRIYGYEDDRVLGEAGNYDINVIASNATFSAAMYGVGG